MAFTHTLFVLLIVLSVSSLALAVDSTVDVDVVFSEWTAKHGKFYSNNVERDHRLKVFSDTLHYINTHNALTNTTFKLGLNQFSDLTNDEFRTKYTGLKRKSRTASRTASTSSKVVSHGKLTSSSLDWRKRGAVTKVKNQQNCGACWAFSTVGSIEGANFLATNNLVSLSEQQLIDCDTQDMGCDGGLMENAFEYLLSSGGIDSEKDYPYKAKQNSECSYRAGNSVVTISGYQKVRPNDPDALMEALNKVPVSISIDGGDPNFQSYASGIFSGDCGTEMDHAVLLVGYGGSGEDVYWILKNQWGTGWGEDGYMRIVRKDGEGQCGMNQDSSFAMVS